MELSTFEVSLILGAVSFLFFYNWLNRPVRRLPPCPVGPLPIFGNVREFLSDIRPKMNQWRERCGDVTRSVTRLNVKYSVVPEKSARSSAQSVYSQSTVSLHILRNFGLGKTLLADKIQKELHHYTQHLSVNTGKPIDIFPMTNEQKKREQSGVTTTMDERNLKMIFFDLFAAGSETTSTTIYWFALYMLHHPDVQKKIFDEINENVGTERVPNMKDKQNLTYLNAAIMETQRLASIVPNSVPRTCHSDMQVRGYTIPKDAFILPCLDSVLHDSQIWGHDLMAFNPERFISQDGK
ncbi:cytochrome P450 2U1 [Biomphalaria glabrata]|nr:cytochrome P450 2U1-like [Biomphalaria glabrata]